MNDERSPAEILGVNDMGDLDESPLTESLRKAREEREEQRALHDAPRVESEPHDMGPPPDDETVCRVLPPSHDGEWCGLPTVHVELQRSQGKPVRHFGRFTSWE